MWHGYCGYPNLPITKVVAIPLSPILITATVLLCDMRCDALVVLELE